MTEINPIDKKSFRRPRIFRRSVAAAGFVGVLLSGACTPSTGEPGPTTSTTEVTTTTELATTTTTELPTTTTTTEVPRLKLFDGNNDLIGIEPVFVGPNNQAFNQQLGRLVIFDNLGRIKTSDVTFDRPNCSGNAYYSTRDNSPISPQLSLGVIKNTLNFNHYYITDNSVAPVYTALPSYRDDNNVCNNSTFIGNVYRLDEVTLPFQEPIVQPLRLSVE